jgi:hypothetical protein
MAAATCQAQIGTGGSVSWATAEGGVKFNTDATATGTTPIAIPTATATNFSWVKYLVLAVTGAGTTNITNRCVSMSGATATGLKLWYQALAVASYSVPAATNQPSTIAGANGGTPVARGGGAAGTYLAMTTSPVQYDNTSVATSGTGPNGSMIVCVLGVDNLFVGGPGNATALPSIILQYDEA